MDEDYDVVVLGTGLTECIVSALLAKSGRRVLHLDRNEYYGSSSASVDLAQLFRICGRDGAPPASYGKVQSWSIDLCPKFIMGSGTLVRILVHTGIHAYLTLRAVRSSWVLRTGKLHRVPSSEREAMSSSLLGLIEKYRCVRFFTLVRSYAAANPPSGAGDLRTLTACKLFDQYSLQPLTREFVGHALALYTNDDYLDRPAHEMVVRIQRYASSLARFKTSSPFLYPQWGLGELPQSFTRLCAISGGTFMLRTEVDAFVCEGEGGHVSAVQAHNDILKLRGAPRSACIVGDPSYFQDRITRAGAVIRAVALIQHPISGTEDADSCQIILPYAQVNRRHDIYISCISSAHKVVPKGWWVATISTTQETEDPRAELEHALRLLKPIVDLFIWTDPVYTWDVDAARAIGFHISHSIDATHNFESIITDAVRIFTDITGQPPDLTPAAPAAQSASAAQSPAA